MSVTWGLADSSTEGVSSQYVVSTGALSSASFSNKNQPKVWCTTENKVWHTDIVRDDTPQDENNS